MTTTTTRGRPDRDHAVGPRRQYDRAGCLCGRSQRAPDRVRRARSRRRLRLRRRPAAPRPCATAHAARWRATVPRAAAGRAAARAVPRWSWCPSWWSGCSGSSSSTRGSTRTRSGWTTCASSSPRWTSRSSSCQRELAQRESPGELRAAAARLGLVPAGTPAFISLPTARWSACHSPHRAPRRPGGSAMTRRESADPPRATPPRSTQSRATQPRTHPVRPSRITEARSYHPRGRTVGRGTVASGRGPDRPVGAAPRTRPRPLGRTRPGPAGPAGDRDHESFGRGPGRRRRSGARTDPDREHGREQGPYGRTVGRTGVVPLRRRVVTRSHSASRRWPTRARRLRLGTALMLALFLVIAGRLVQFQLTDAPAYAAAGPRAAAAAGRPAGAPGQHPRPRRAPCWPAAPRRATSTPTRTWSRTRRRPPTRSRRCSACRAPSCCRS